MIHEQRHARTHEIHELIHELLDSVDDANPEIPKGKFSHSTWAEIFSTLGVKAEDTLQIIHSLDSNRDGFVDKNVLLDSLGLMRSVRLEDQLEGAGKFFGPANGGTVRHKKDDEESLGHELRGLSVHYLSTSLLEEVRSVGLADDAQIYEIEPLVIRGKGKSVTCPRDGRLGAAYVDCVEEGHAHFSTHMLSYTWGYSIKDISDGILVFCANEKLDPKQTYFWICCLCINQHRVREARARGDAIPFEEFQEKFGQTVRGIRHIVALMAPWTQPLYIRRVWCNFEMFTAIKLGDERCKVSVAMPPREAEDMRNVLLKQGNIDKLWQVMTNINIESSEASVMEDKQNILSLIEQSYGFPDLNEAVATCLKMWVLACCEWFLEREFEKLTSSDQDLVKACTSVGKLLRSVGCAERAIQVLDKGRFVCERADILMTLDGAKLVREIGVAYYVAGKPDRELQAYEEARRIRKYIGALDTPDGAKLLTNIGEARRKGADLTSAQDAYVAARRIRELTNTLETADGASLLTNIGDLKCDNGDVQGALEALEAAKRIHTSRNTLQTPDGAMCLTSLGVARLQGGNLAGALEAYEAAWWICKQTVTLHVPEGEILVARMRDTPEGAALLEKIDAMSKRMAYH